MNYYKHPKALVESDKIGEGTRVWAFAHILPNAIIGKDCNICDHVFIENDVCIGDRVTIKCGVQIWDGVELEDDVFVGPNATFANDPLPRSRQWRDSYPQTIVKAGASIGANATILPGLKIGRKAMVGAGAVVTHDVPPNAIVLGKPAYITGYLESVRNAPPSQIGAPTVSGSREARVKGVKLINLPQYEDIRGQLSVGTLGSDVPFQPKRYFIVYNVPTQMIRGEHAHRQCHQFLVCLRGECKVVVEDGKVREESLLNHPNIGIYIPPMIWATQYGFSSDATLLVFASDDYDPEDYIRDYDEYLKLKHSSPLVDEESATR